MSEDVFFSQQPGMSTLQSQYFNFNAHNGAELLEPPPMLPNPLLAPDHGINMSMVADHSRSTQANWQDELVSSYGRVIPTMPEADGHHVSQYDDEDDDAMSISDDGLIEAANSRGLQTLTKTWNGARADARKFDFFAQCGALFSYMDSPANSELRNQGEITIFSYFLNITSPTISMYERHPCDPVEKQEFHSKGHNLWACKFFLVMAHMMISDRKSHRYATCHCISPSGLVTRNACAGELPTRKDTRTDPRRCHSTLLESY